MVHHLLRGEVIMGLHNSQVLEEDCQDQGLGDNLHPQEDLVAGALLLNLPLIPRSSSGSCLWMLTRVEELQL